MMSMSYIFIKHTFLFAFLSTLLKRNNISSIATVILALATFWLARTTLKSVELNRQTFDQAERHFTSKIMPILIIDFKDVESNYFFGKAFNQEENRIVGCLKNTGSGPALEISYYLVGIAGQLWTHHFVVTSIIAPGGYFELDREILSSDAIGSNDPMIVPDTMFIYIEYKDILGNNYRTIHHKIIMSIEGISNGFDRPMPEFIKDPKPMPVPFPGVLANSKS
jgi:hypothetical protein